jgi:hypothetical protein
MEAILNSLYNTSSEFIICGDFNVNYLDYNNRRNQLDALLSTFNLFSTVCFPTRTLNGSASAIDNIFVEFNRKESYSINPLVNGLSDHDGQLLYMNNINLQISSNSFQSIRSFSIPSMNEFTIQLSYETRDDVFTDCDMDTIFNSFLNTYLRIFYSNFPSKQTKVVTRYNPWLTKGIRVSCQHKRDLYITLRSNNDPKLKLYYKNYCKILSKVIRAAKNLHYSRLISNSNNKAKTTWNVIKSISGKNNKMPDIELLNIDGYYRIIAL